MLYPSVHTYFSMLSPVQVMRPLLSSMLSHSAFPSAPHSLRRRPTDGHEMRGPGTPLERGTGAQKMGVAARGGGALVRDSGRHAFLLFDFFLPPPAAAGRPRSPGNVFPTNSSLIYLPPMMLLFLSWPFHCHRVTHSCAS